MYCRNCSNEVNEKAIACPKCGVNPRSEKNYCPSCGSATNSNQIACTNCGVSLANTSSFNLEAIKLPQLQLASIKDVKTLATAVIGMIGYFLTWLEFSSSVMGMGSNSQQFSGPGLTAIGDQLMGGTTGILIPALLYLFPLALIAYVLADFLPQLAKYKKMFCIAALVLVAYAFVGILTMDINLPEGGMISREDVNVRFSPGFGLYISLVATIAMAFFYGLFTKK
jgi:hypothetical protein